jgi:hypothetical protein
LGLWLMLDQDMANLNGIERTTVATVAVAGRESFLLD